MSLTIKKDIVDDDDDNNYICDSDGYGNGNDVEADDDDDCKGDDNYLPLDGSWRFT